MNWHHAPLHRLRASGAYMITGATLKKQKFFGSSQALDLLSSTLQGGIQQYGLGIRAWALFPNHYHLILLRYPDSGSLKEFIRHLHSRSGRLLNQMESCPGRKVWFQYWDTELSYESSYYARLNYVMQNPVRHGLVAKAEDYPWCSARWFQENADPGHHRTVTSFKIDRVKVQDDF